MEFKGALTGNLFGFDSKCIYKEWIKKDGSKNHIRIPIGVAVNPSKNSDFEKNYEKIMSELFEQYGLEHNRNVYSSSEIGMMFPPNSEEYRNFCLAFTRKIMNLDDVKYTFFLTTFNKKYLVDEKITINGEYGSTTRMIGIEEFINLILDSYNIICAWKLMRQLKTSKQTLIFDGTSTIRDCEAWNLIKNEQNAKIVFNADKTIPVVSTADIILRNLDFFIKDERKFVDEKTLQKIIHYDEKISNEGKYYYYIGNPDLKYIKPLSERIFSMYDLKDCLHKPIIYIYAGNVPGQKELIESSPIMESIMNFASSIYANVKIYEPKKDSRIIGCDKNITDYFYPMGSVAEETLSVLIASKKNVKRLDL